MSVAAGHVQERCDVCGRSCSEKLYCIAVLFAACLVKESFIICCRSCLAKLCCWLQVLFRKGVLLAANFVQESFVFIRKTILFEAGLVQKRRFIHCRSCSDKLYCLLWVLFRKTV